MNTWNLTRLGIFRKVQLIEVENILKYRFNLSDTLIIQQRNYSFRHSTRNLIATILCTQLIHDNLWQMLYLIQGFYIIVGKRITCTKKFLKSNRKHIHDFYLSNGYCHLASFHGNTQK